MKEHKYKIWDKDLKAFSEYTGTNYEGQSINEFFQDKDLVFLEYTGLLDKNKREIYEGDIIEWRWYGETSKGELLKTIIEWDDYSLQWYARPNALHRLVENNKNKEIEVIGNIYENSKLAKA